MTEQTPIGTGSSSAPRDLTDPDDLSPARLLAMAEDQRARATTQLVVDSRLLLGAWGIAWFLGFGLFWAASPFREGPPPLDVPIGIVGAVHAALLIAAAVVTMVHIIRRSRGVRGTSARQGAMYGWTWMLGFFTTTFVISSALEIAGPALAPELAALLFSAAPGLVVGLMYCAGGALWNEPVQYGLGAWLLVTTALGSVTGVTGLYLTMSLAGGGGFLLGAVVLGLRQARR